VTNQAYDGIVPPSVGIALPILVTGRLVNRAPRVSDVVGARRQSIACELLSQCLGYRHDDVRMSARLLDTNEAPFVHRTAFNPQDKEG